MKNKRIFCITIFCFLILFEGVSCKTSHYNETIDKMPSMIDDKGTTYGQMENLDENEHDSSINIIKNNQAVISVEEAKKTVEDFFRTPEIGVQAVYNDKFSMVFDENKYYYFDVVYNLLMGDETEITDKAVTKVFVNANNLSIYEAVEDNDSNLSIGKLLSD